MPKATEVWNTKGRTIRSRILRKNPDRPKRAFETRCDYVGGTETTACAVILIDIASPPRFMRDPHGDFWIVPQRKMLGKSLRHVHR